MEISENTLVPGDGARLSETRFETWLKQIRRSKATRGRKEQRAPRLSGGEF